MMRAFISTSIVFGATADTKGFCCYWPEAGDLDNCGDCTKKAYDTEGKADCESDKANTWCPAGAPPSGQTSCKITAYGYDDNFPPSAIIAHAGRRRQHSKATEGTGTHDDPITFATEKNFIPEGTIIYVAHVRKYFVMEDDCKECSDDYDQGIKHVDLWMGPNNGPQGSALHDCEYNSPITQDHGQIIINPSADLPVETTPLFDGSTCTDKFFGGHVVV